MEKGLLVKQQFLKRSAGKATISHKYKLTSMQYKIVIKY